MKGAEFRLRTKTNIRRHILRVGLLALIFIAAIPAQAQNVTPWAAVSPEEMAFKEVPGVAGAPAVILYREVQTDDEKRFETHFYRVKILTEQGKKYADVEIPYFLKRMQIDDIRARTIQPNGAIAEFHGQIYDRLVAKARKVSYQARAFTIPDANVGTIVEYAYTVRWKEAIPDVIRNPSKYYITGADSFLTSRWTVHDDLFIRRARFGLRPVRNARIVYTWLELPPDRKPVTNTDGSVTLEVENFPAFISEEFMPPESSLKARVDLFYTVGWVPSVNAYWSSQARQGAERIDKFLGESKTFTRYVERIVSPADSPETKLRKIYDYVQKIRSINYEPARTEKERKSENLETNKSAEDIIKHGYGYGNEINYLFVALARAAGFQTVVAQVTSRNSDFFTRQVLDTGQLNSIVVAVAVNSQMIFLDPATHYCPYGLLPWEESDAEGIALVAGDNPFVKTSTSTSADAVVERKLDVKLDAEGGMSGTLAYKFFGQEALSWRLHLLNKDEVARRKDIEDYVKEELPAGSSVELADVANRETVNEPLVVRMRVQIPQFTTRAGRRVLLTAGVLQTTNRTQFQSATRVHPVYFRHAYRLLDDVRIELPGDLSVESMPQPKNEKIAVLSFESKYERVSGGGSPVDAAVPAFREQLRNSTEVRKPDPTAPVQAASGQASSGQTSAGQAAAVLHFQRRQEMGGYYFTADNYRVLREFFAKMHAADEQQVVLVPTQAVAAK